MPLYHDDGAGVDLVLSKCVEILCEAWRARSGSSGVDMRYHPTRLGVGSVTAPVVSARKALRARPGPKTAKSIEIFEISIFSIGFQCSTDPGGRVRALWGRYAVPSDAPGRGECHCTGRLRPEASLRAPGADNGHIDRN